MTLCFLVCLPNQFASQIQEGLLVVVVALSRDLMVLQVLLSVECDLLWLHLPVLDINLVSTKDNRHILTHPMHQRFLVSGSKAWLRLNNSAQLKAQDMLLPTQVTMPRWHILVRES